MAFGDGPDDAQLRRTWHSFCDQLKEAGELAFSDGVPPNSLDRAAGLRLVARNIPLALAFHFENCDPLRPEIMRYFDPSRKQGGDNGDAVYLGAQIDGRLRYRISGRRGAARYLAITSVERGDTPWGGGVADSLFNEQLKTDADGNFELLLGPEQPADSAVNYLRTTPDTFRVTFRQFFADWQGEEPMTARIDCLDAPDEPAAPLNAAALEHGLAESVDWLRFSTSYWAEKMDLWRARPLEFISWHEMEHRKIDATPGGTPLICWWEAAPDEAVVVRVRPPRCSYWNCEFGNYWFETMDYRQRRSSINCHHATLEDDGELIIVISHEDSGHANWMDPSGHHSGYMTIRWMEADDTPRPQCQRLPMAQLAEALPPTAKRVDAAGRAAQQEALRRGACQRFRC